MPFYIRKAISVGPLRFNLSKSGVGVSLGVRGLRLGSGARGNYVHAGRYGIYYRKSLGGKPIGTATMLRDLAQGEDTRAGDARSQQFQQPDTEALEEIDSKSALLMIEATSEELLLELNEKRKRQDMWPWFLAATLVATLATIALRLPAWAWGTVAVLGGLLIVLC